VLVRHSLEPSTASGDAIATWRAVRRELRRAMGTRRRRGDAAPAWAARDVNDAGAGYACGVTIAIRVMRPVDATEVPRDLRDDWRIR
jgi:hypothetical protein